MGMKPINSKRLERKEKKKKKLAAHLEIAKLNDHDRKMTGLLSVTENSTPPPKRLCTEIVNGNNHLKEECKTTEMKHVKPKLEGDDYLKLKKELRERSNKLKILPRIWLRDMGTIASLSVNIDNRVPLFVYDIQHLIMYSQLGPHTSYAPSRWCQLDKFNRLNNTTVLIIENISMYDYVSNESLFPYLKSKFDVQLEIVNPAAYNGNLIRDLLMVPLTGSQTRKFISQYGSLEKAAAKKEVFNILRNVFPILNENENSSKDLPPTDKFPRTDLLLSGWQMVEENIPLPIYGLMDRKYQGYVLSKDEYKMVTPHSPMFGLDCEMCKTTTGENELTRVSVVNEKHEVVYETLVKPKNRIVDYLTRFSGITARMMKGVTKTVEDVQKELRELLPPDAIMIGQSIGFDLHSLRMFHPYIIDTSIIYNVTGERIRKTKLQHLAKQFLNERIQESRAGHCSVEDSLASLKLVQHKLTQNLYYGDAVMSGGQQSQFVTQPDIGHPNFATSMLRHVMKQEKNVAVYGSRAVLDIYKKLTFKGVYPCKNMRCEVAEGGEDIVAKMVEAGHGVRIGHVVHDQSGDGADCSKIDAAIKRLHEQTEGPSLQIVLFSGRSQPSTSNGCCFITVKKY